MKYLAKIVAAFLAIVVAATVAMCCLTTDAQEKKTQPQYVVVFMFKVGNVPGPDCRINVLVNAWQEGDAAIAAHKFLTEKLTTNAAENLVYLECQRKQ